MPQVNTLVIDIAPSKDFSPALSGASSSSKNSNKDFSKVIDEHYQSQESGKKQESSGNKSKLETEVIAKNESVDDKSLTTKVQPKEHEIGSVSDEEMGAEIDESANAEQRLATGKSKNINAAQLDNIETEVAKHKGDVVINVNNESSAPAKLDNSTEKLMSFLSASQKILTGDVKSDSANTPQVNEKKLTVDSGTEHKEITELDLLLKQVLGVSNKDKSAKTTDNSTESNDDKTLTKQLKLQAAIKGEALISKATAESPSGTESASSAESKLTSASNTMSASDFITQADKATKADVKESLSVPLDNKAESEQVITVKTTDSKIEQSNSKAPRIQVEQATDNKNIVKQPMSASEMEALLKDGENSAIKIELEAIKRKLLGSQDKSIPVEKDAQSTANVDNKVAKGNADTESPLNTQNKVLLNEVATHKDVDIVNTDKAAFAGVTISGEKQAQETSQNHSRVINQSTQNAVEQKAAGTGEQSQQQSLEQEKQKQSLSVDEKLVKSEVQLKEKPFSELFDKKVMNTSIENAVNRDVRQVNEATKSTASAEEMITKLSSENVQSTAQSVSNAKQLTSLQNEALSVYRKDFSGAVKDKVMVMMNQKLQQIEIRLDPQELGNVNVKINLQNEQATVSFTVQNQQAKEAFDQNLGRLKDMLAESGVDVGDANVEQQNKQNDGEELADNRGSGDGDTSGNDLSELNGTETLNLTKGSSTGVDYYA